MNTPITSADLLRAGIHPVTAWVARRDGKFIA